MTRFGNGRRVIALLNPILWSTKILQKLNLKFAELPLKPEGKIQILHFYNMPLNSRWPEYQS